VPWYYAKETVRNIWNRTIQGYLMQGSFTENPKKCFAHTKYKSSVVRRYWKKEEEED
jgi:hypothetical protein